MTDQRIIDELNANWDFVDSISCYTNNNRTECFVVSRCIHKIEDEVIYIVCDKNKEILCISKNLDEASDYALELSQNTSVKHRSSPNWWWN